MTLQPGDKVRLKANPGRIGMLGNETDGPAGRQRVLVMFLDGQEDFVLPGALEKVGAGKQGPYELIRSGRFGRTSDLRGLTTYYRLSGRLANLIYSLNTTNTEFYAYQFKPVLQFLDSPSKGILIADEVGLGKTIEAGLIWTELHAREDARRLLVVCPAMLCEKWRAELGQRFGVNAQIVDAGELLDRLQNRQDHYEGFAYIASVQGIRPSRGWDDKTEPAQTAAAKLARFLDDPGDPDALFDLVIIDEAHYLRNRETQTHRLGQLLRDVTQNMVMLSATPVQLGNRDLFNLVHLLDPDAFGSELMFGWSLEANAPLVALRDKVRASGVRREEFLAGLQQAMQSPFLRNSQQLQHLLEYPPAEDKLSSPAGRAEVAEQLDRINPLGKVVTRTLKRDVQENRVQRAPRVIKATMTPTEAAFYEEVTNTVRNFCADLNMSEGFLLTIPQRQMASSMAAACRRWTAEASPESADGLDELLHELDANENGTDSKGSGVLLRELKSIAIEAGSFQALARADSKYAVLSSSLKEYWSQYPGNKVVLFSFYRHTLYYLAERLLADGIEPRVLHGGMDKQAALEAFQHPDGPAILLSSEVAAEGVDLQFSSLLINYDLPWNPARIEQRIGRIDRIGQRAPKVLIWNLVYEDTIDDRIYERLLDRLDIFRQSLGSMEVILGSEIRRLTHDLLSHKLTSAEERERIDRSRMAIETENRIQVNLEKQASNLIAHGEFVQNKVRAARELGRYIRGEDLFAYVNDFLTREYPGTRVLATQPELLQFKLDLPVMAKVDFERFVEELRLKGITSLLTASPPELRFDNRLQRKIPGVEFVTQDHPLVRFVGARIRRTGGDVGYLPVSAIALSSVHVPPSLRGGTYVYAVMRWSFTGSRDIERLEYVAASLDSGTFLDSIDAERLVNGAALKGEDWLGAAGAVDALRAADLQEECRRQLDEQFAGFVAHQQREDADRIQLMIDLLNKHLSRKQKRSAELIASYEASGDEKRRRMIPVERGRLEKEEARVHERMEQLRIRHHAAKSLSSPVSAGVIMVD